jgi:hypothetical protein
LFISDMVYISVIGLNVANGLLIYLDFIIDDIYIKFF